MGKISLQTKLHAALAVISFVLFLGNIFVVRALNVFGSPFLFAISILVELLLLVVFVYSLIRALQTPLHILGSILLSAWEGMLTNPYVKSVKKANSSLYRWLIARLNPKKPTGLILTIGIVISLVFFVGFTRILQDVWFHEPLTRIDTRVVNLMPSIRTPLQTSFFRFVTMTAELASVALLVLLSCAVLWRKRQRLAAGLLVVALVIEEGGSFVLKHVVGRVRPAQALSLVKEDSFSFPSGHVLRATVLFGLLSYLLYRSFKSSILRLIIILGYIVSVALVAMSRVYLGVHYPSDVLASMLFGASLLTLLITAIEITIRYKLWQQTAKSFINRLLALVPLVVVVFSLVVAPVFIHITSVVAVPALTTLSSIDQAAVKRLPLYSETLTGKTMEPINFIYIGSQQQIEHLFESHGWYKADPSTIANTLRAVAIGFQGHQYLNAPVTPSYLNAKPENLAFQKPTQSNTLKQRHHTRLWRTDFRLPDGREIWVATASYDEGIEFAGPAKLPTHHIDPNVDAERNYIVSSLGISDTNFLQVVNPQAGKNASGDVFFTDGKAVVIQLYSRALR
jgi:membrane-associated phospholipid phosphatase